MVKTDKQIEAPHKLPCPQCGSNAECTGVDLIGPASENVWRDKYWCGYCKRRFYNEALALWCDMSSGEFYAYAEETADASN